MPNKQLKVAGDVSRGGSINRAGDGMAVKATTDATLLVMDGEPIAEPVAGHGPFVMNTRPEIQRAFEDYQLGKMGAID